MPTPYTLAPAVVEAIRARKPFGATIDPFLIGYKTRGGSYLLASNGRQDDYGMRRDLLLVTATDTVIELRITVNPELTEAVRLALTPVEIAR